MTKRSWAYKSGRDYGMDTKRLPTVIYLDREVLESLNDLADATDRKRADLLREAVQRLLVAYSGRKHRKAP